MTQDRGKAGWLLASGLAVLVVAIFAKRFIQTSGGSKPRQVNSGSNSAVYSSAAGAAAKHGEAVFLQHCSVCHSPDTDDVIVGPSLKDYLHRAAPPLSSGAPAPKTDASIRELLQHGTRNMPPISQDLSQQDTADLLVFLHTL